jgi:hypothetical protein
MSKNGSWNNTEQLPKVGASKRATGKSKRYINNRLNQAGEIYSGGS